MTARIHILHPEPDTWERDNRHAEPEVGFMGMAFGWLLLVGIGFAMGAAFWAIPVSWWLTR